MRVGANSPSLWPTMFSVMYTGMNFFPLCTAIVWPTISGMTVDRLISDLTDLAQIESGKLRVQLERCDAVEIVRDVVGLYEAHTRDR